MDAGEYIRHHLTHLSNNPASTGPVDFSVIHWDSVFFSIAIGIRNRTVLVDLRQWANFQDAVLRMVIGMIAAMVLVMLIESGAIHFSVGDAKLPDDLPAGASVFKPWLYILLAGFLGGFSERLVPDMLDKLSNESVAQAGNPSPPANPASAAAPSASAVPGPGATAAAPQPVADPSARDDHCLTGGAIPPELVTPDNALPPASGGVAAAR